VAGRSSFAAPVAEDGGVPERVVEPPPTKENAVSMPFDANEAIDSTDDNTGEREQHNPDTQATVDDANVPHPAGEGDADQA